MVAYPIAHPKTPKEAYGKRFGIRLERLKSRKHKIALMAQSQKAAITILNLGRGSYEI
jgi:hypothetical protein